MLLEIFRNECCEVVTVREWEQIREKSTSPNGGWYVELKKSGCGRA